MNKIIMLGVGHGTVLDLYNTCFVIQNDKGNFLIDTGGSIEIIKRLKQQNIELNDINHIFISHSHTDHLFGLIWMFKEFCSLYLGGNLKTQVNIYCNDQVLTAIKEISKQVLPEPFLSKILEVIKFHILTDNEQVEINDIKYTFFDALGKGPKLYGFKCLINNKKLIFLGDEPLKQELYNEVRDSDYVMHEAFCLEEDEHIFNAHKKNHETVKSVCEVMNNLNVKNLILFHTEESHGKDRKKVYLEEACEVFDGNVFVPDELEEINII